MEQNLDNQVQEEKQEAQGKEPGSKEEVTFSRAVIVGLSLLVSAAPAVFAQNVGVVLPAGGKFSTLERADLRKFENGTFVGLEYRETRGVLDWQKVEEGDLIQGTYFVMQSLDHLGVNVARRVDESFPVSYVVGPDGSCVESQDQGYPTLRGFPVFPSKGFSPGDDWRATGERVVDAAGNGQFTRMRFLADYRCSALDPQKGATVTATYAIRYKKGDDPAGDPDLLSVSGTHAVSLQLAPSSGALSLMSDRVQETYTFSGSKTVSYEGFILTWFNATTPLDREDTARTIAQTLRDEGQGDVDIAQGPEGVSVSLNDIHFVADQAVVLPEELPRLAALADALKKVPNRTFRVVGHTARFGTPESEDELSVERAKAIVDALVARGIPASRFIYEGRGSRDPVAPNDTEENMAKNRRVEVVVLEN